MGVSVVLEQGPILKIWSEEKELISWSISFFDCQTLGHAVLIFCNAHFGKLGEVLPLQLEPLILPVCSTSP
jgi:hypothetical protein